ncbi:MAG: trypsin-like peptidase domain-containing protein [Paludibacteraceae bacterium]|nr:trypsin-like peptidase domain-containing protein [Paludibacteraceae bacterium]
MNKQYFFTIILFLVFSFGLFAQISEGGFPNSYYDRFKSSAVIPSLGLETIDIKSLLNEDKSNGILYRYGVTKDVNINIKSEGVKTQVGAGAIWRYKLVADSAKSLKMLFSKFNIPQGASLFVYNSDYSVVYGAYTRANVTPDSTFAIADFPGNELTLEYYEPSTAVFSGSLMLGKVSQAYRDLKDVMSTITTTEDSLYVDVNCGGLDWQVQKHAICRYSFVEDTSSYLCSGSLINNINNDGTPYFLTAHHCVSSTIVAQTVIAYFNYETKGCGLGAKINYNKMTLSGASLISTGANSDYTLLKFTSTPPAAYQPYYAGWDLTNWATSTVGIHHPEGLKKKISFDYDAPTTFDWVISWNEGSDSPANTHWLVSFDKGHVGAGSSGSPLFNQNKRIIGQLHGGGTSDSYYGKLNYSWTHSDVGYSMLKNYLAGGKDSTYLNGYFPITNPPDASFFSGYTKVCLGAPIAFTDHSAFNITSWKWTFTPSTVAFLNSTSASSQNPVVSFNNPGTYSVKLNVQNSAGKDSVTATIVAGSTLVLSYESTPASGTCLSSVDSVVVTGGGATKFSWQLSSASRAYFNLDTLSSQKAVIKQKSTATIDSTITITGVFVGTQASCVDSSAFSIQLERPSNDNIANAKLIKTGVNGPFSNECATVETGEPKPPGTSCTSQKAWCAESTSGSVLNNTVWFYFYGPASGGVTIEADSIDGQIALYSADSYQNILSGNYTLLAANDDISSNNSNARINSVNVTSGKKYWLQFDGSNGGDVGTFYIKMDAVNSTIQTKTVDSVSSSGYTLYPSPANSYLIIKGNGLKGLSSVDVDIFNCFGKKVYSKQLTKVVSDNKVTVYLDKDMPDGVYIVSLTGSDTSYNKLFIKAKE